MSNVQQRGGGSWRVWRGGDGFRDCRAGSEWRRFWSVGGFFFTSHSPRDPWGYLEKWRNDAASQPARRQERQCFLDQQPGPGQRERGECDSRFELLNRNALSGSPLSTGNLGGKR